MPEPWKNGDGVTRTLATDRRIDTTTSGPFSTFEQVDRTLILLHDGPLILNRSGAPIQRKTTGRPVHPIIIGRP